MKQSQKLKKLNMKDIFYLNLQSFFFDAIYLS